MPASVIRSFLSHKPTGTAPLWLLGLVALCGILAAHIFIPALPRAASTLGTTPQTVQLTISVYIAGLAVGELIYGPIADRFGQRHVLLAGLSIFIIASLGAWLATSIEALIALRFLQSLGGGAGLVLARAIARRGVDAREATRRLALMNLVITLGPVLAPIIGATITGLVGWRFIFLTLALLGILNFAGTWARVPEIDHAPPKTSAVVRAYLRLFINPLFVAYSVSGGCFTTSMYAIIGASPFILTHQFGYSIEQVGPVLASGTAGIWTGSILTSRLIRHVCAQGLLLAGGLCNAIASFTFFYLVISASMSVPALILTLALFMIGVGLSGPPALAMAMSTDPAALGSGSGLYGSAQMAIGAICSFGASLGSDPAHGAAYTICIATLLGFACILGIAMVDRSAGQGLSTRA